METWKLIAAGLLIAVAAYLVALYFAFKHSAMPGLKDVKDNPEQDDTGCYSDYTNPDNFQIKDMSHKAKHYPGKP